MQCRELSCRPLTCPNSLLSALTLEIFIVQRRRAENARNDRLLINVTNEGDGGSEFAGAERSVSGRGGDEAGDEYEVTVAQGRWDQDIVGEQQSGSIGSRGERRAVRLSEPAEASHGVAEDTTAGSVTQAVSGSLGSTSTPRSPHFSTPQRSPGGSRRATEEHEHIGARVHGLLQGGGRS